MPDEAVVIGRLRWRCRRGMKELDLLLTRYLHEQWPGASSEQRGLFEAFLELPDPQIAAYLVAGEAADTPALGALIHALREGRS